MRILIVSDRAEKKSPTDFLANVFYKKYEADIVYTRFNEESLSFIDRILNKFNIELDKSNINTRLIKKLSEKKYDVLFIWKGNRIYPWILKKIRKLYPALKIVSWSGDNMTKWHNKSLFYHFGLIHYHSVFSVNIPDYKNIEKNTRCPVFYFDKRADKYMHKPLNPGRVNFKYEVLFIGSFEKERFKTLSFLASSGIKIDIYGSMWDRCKYALHENLQVHYKQLIADDYVQAISNSKITLGFLRKINCDTQTSRTFEIPACNGFMLMERTHEHLRLFEEGVEAEYFDTDSELLEKIKKYLMADNERERIALNGYKRVVESGYYFDNLASQMLDKLRDL